MMLLCCWLACSGAFDYILIETTGLANPGPIVSAFWLDEGLNAGLYLDGVVAVVDAVNLERELAAAPAHCGGAGGRGSGGGFAAAMGEAAQQIACADVVLLNKQVGLRCVCVCIWGLC